MSVLKLGVQGQTHSQEDGPQRPLLSVCLSFGEHLYPSSCEAAGLSKPTTYISYPPHLGGVVPEDTPPRLGIEPTPDSQIHSLVAQRVTYRKHHSHR